MENLIDFIPIIIPIVLLELTLAITALIHVIRHPNYRFGSKVFWIIIVLLVQIIGPISYFIFGRKEE